MPPKRRQPTANLFDVDLNRAVNSQMVRTTSRNRNQPLPGNLANMNASEPRQVRNILKQDVKDARARMIESASTPSAGKRAYWADSDLRRQRHIACGAAKGKKALRFLTEGSRDLWSDILPGCYMDPKGSRIRKGRGLAVPLIRRHFALRNPWQSDGLYALRGGAVTSSLTVRDLEPYTLRLRFMRARTPHLMTEEALELLQESEEVMTMHRQGFDIDPAYIDQLRTAMQSFLNNFHPGHTESKE